MNTNLTEPIAPRSKPSSRIPLRAFLFYQLQRHGAMTAPQISRMLVGRTVRSNIYRYLRNWMDQGYVKRMAHPTKYLFAYCATPLAYPCVRDLDPEDEFRPGGLPLRDVDLEHVLMCTEVMTALAFFENVTGIATEHELDPRDLLEVVPGRIPDGIFQIYARALQKRAPRISAALFIVPHLKNYQAYEKAIGELPPEIAEGFKLRRQVDLSDLGLQDLGARLEIPGFASESMRIALDGRIQYLPLKSREREISTSPNTHLSEPPVTEMENDSSPREFQS